MKNFKSEFLCRAQERGFVHQSTDPDRLDNLFIEQRVNAYIGFDCTAPSLHVGSLISIMLLRLLQRSGHKPIVLMGGGTTQVGDPSGKEETRKLIDNSKIESNMANLKTIFSKFLKFGEGPTDAIMVDNADWLCKLQYIPFLREYGRFFSVNRMLGFDSVKLRLNREQNLSFLEFNYMILQAYDFLELSRRFNCRLQMGGSDQWGNIVNGIDLAHKIDGVNIFGLTTPLLTTSSGAKMGKTANGAIWLNKEMLSPYDYWQFWRNSEDANIGHYFRLFTDLSLQEIKEIENDTKFDINNAKKILATEITQLSHGKTAATSAQETAEKTFETGGFGIELPKFSISLNRLKEGIPAFQLFKESGLADSGSAARRLIKSGGGKVNDSEIGDEMQKVTELDLNNEGFIKLSAGKKRHILIHGM